LHPVKDGATAIDPFQPQAIPEIQAATPMLTGMNQEALKAILEDMHLGRLVAPEEIASLIGHCAENEALNATTIEITGGLCYPKGIAK
jgi:3-oxoacyl-[acyl-carrier protein] reductase